MTIGLARYWWVLLVCGVIAALFYAACTLTWYRGEVYPRR
jgi:membrane associated rhomboid family serine protease